MTLDATRRSVLAAGAWALPVMGSAVLVPSSVASPTGTLTVVTERSRLYPDEATTVRVTRSDDAGRPRPGDPVTLTLDDPSRGVIDQPSGVTDGAGVYETSLRIRSDAASGIGTLTGSSAASVASATFEVRPVAVVMHAADGASTRVIALSHGSQDEVMTLENRGFAHSDLQPTGRHVSRGEVIDVVVDADAPATLSLFIGARGPWRGFNSGQTTDLQTVSLSRGQQSVAAAQDGIVFVRNTSSETAAEVSLSGGSPHPVWVKNRTTATEFADQLAAWTSAPVVSLVGDRVVVDVQRRVVDDLGTRGVSWDPADVVLRLDRVLSYTCDVYGLTYAAVGIAHKYPGRVYFSGPDSGAGWAFATNQWLCFQVDTGASEALLTTPDNWGTWHEVGHTFQTPAYTWSGLGEVTVNISSLALQQRLTGEHRLDQWPEAKDRITRYFSQAVGDRSFSQLTDEDPFYPLFLFDQLRQSFGEGFYPAVSQAYRVRRIRGLAMPSTDQEKKDLFAQIASQVADRDLGPFFTAWGVPIAASVLSSLGTYPALQNQIWTAIDSRDAHRERTVGYNLPVGVLSARNVTLYLGEATSSVGDVSGLSTLDGSPSSVAGRESSAANVGPREGRVLALLRAPDATPEALWRTVPVTVTSALEFVGIYDIRAGWIGMSKDGKRLVVTSTGVAPHDYYFRGKLYYQVILQNAARQTLVSVTVNGDDTHDKVVAALNGVAVSSGYRLRVNAAEPSRVRIYQDGERVGTLSSTPQNVSIRNGRFVV
ncbi:hypothetical protein MTES_0434 [Microbacterium testaceum StLB037]|uniref:Peptidase M60 domain-containing protein n=1 Tax=Microbacterium testaceum (strain StLB037) TaxID=979556 RepID=E8NAX6_MICTS|nr:M60 family metallopeptidase [Microbacterium testaceum]BAJ73398.1 hypothetical protein MTES_0434 [Microbacterium testaceum StLB037]